MLDRLKQLLRGLYTLKGFYHRIKCYHTSTRKFGYFGKGIDLNYPIEFDNPQNVYLYEHTYLSSNSCISTTNAKFILKKYSGAAQNLMVRTGNHDMIVGRFYRTITNKEKRKDLDQDVIVDEDVWIGCNVTLLSGVHIGRGAIIAAGAVVNKNVLPYAIYGGVPAKFIKFKWNIEQILEHEKILYPEEERIPKETLESYFSIIKTE